MKTEILQTSSSENSHAVKVIFEPSPPLEAIAGAATPAATATLPPAAIATAAHPQPEEVISPESIGLASSDDVVMQPSSRQVHHTTTKPIAIPPPHDSNFSTTWAKYPSNSDSQSVLLTKFQLDSGTLIIPIGRARSVLGAFSSNCTVTLQFCSSPSTAPETQQFPCKCILYRSDPENFYLNNLADFFTASDVQAGDVLTLSEVSPGICNAEILRFTSPEAIKFLTLLVYGGDEVSLPMGADSSPLKECVTQVTEDKRSQEEEMLDSDEDMMELDGGSGGEEQNTTSAPLLRKAPRRKASRRKAPRRKDLRRKAPRRKGIVDSGSEIRFEEGEEKEYSDSDSEEEEWRPLASPHVSKSKRQHFRLQGADINTENAPASSFQSASDRRSPAKKPRKF
jgi:hypothetical protein